MSAEEKLKVMAAVQAAATDRAGKRVLRCADAFRIAGECSAGLALVGQICNELKIKIVQCQLGCFK